MKSQQKFSIIATILLVAGVTLNIISPSWWTYEVVQGADTMPIPAAVIAALISAAASIGTKAYSNAKARKAGDKAMAYQRQKEQELQNWYDRNYNEDATQRADAQAALTYAAEMMKQRNKAAQGRQAVMGGTEESVAAEKERNNKTYADIVSNIAAAGAKRKDAIQDQYLKGKLGQLDTMSNIEMGRAGNLQSAGNAMSGIDVNSIAKAFDENDKSGSDSGDSAEKAAKELAEVQDVKKQFEQERGW